MRKDPPFDMNYIFATYVLQRAEEHGTLVVNRPQGLRDANEKAILAWFPTCAPPTLISCSLDAIREFVTEHQKVAVKPLDLMGGQSVFVTDTEDGPSRTKCYDMATIYGLALDISQERNLKLEDVWLTIGPTKLILITRADDAVRSKLVDAALDGVSLRKLKTIGKEDEDARDALVSDVEDEILDAEIVDETPRSELEEGDDDVSVPPLSTEPPDRTEGHGKGSH